MITLTHNAVDKYCKSVDRLLNRAVFVTTTGNNGGLNSGVACSLVLPRL